METIDEKWFIVSWDSTGVEHIEDITKFHPDIWARTQLFEAIKTGEMDETAEKLTSLVTNLKLRARFNSQRHYEIYIFTSSPDMELEDIKAWILSDPQGFADWVRKHHMSKLFDNRTTTKKVIE